MPQIVFSRQVRADRGERISLVVDGAIVRGHFVQGGEKLDPYILWFIDVQCIGAKLPTDPDEVQQWFLDHGNTFARGLRDLAGRYRAGIDVEAVPVEAGIKHLPGGVRGTLTCAATNSLSARNISKALLHTANHWSELVHGLRTLQAAYD